MRLSSYNDKAAAVLLVLFAAACTDATVASKRNGFIQVSVEVSGGDLDLDGFSVVVDGATRYFLSSNTSILLRDIDVGTHTLRLEQVAGNCTVTGEQPQSVTVEAGQTVGLTFHITCVVTGISVTAQATGTDVQDRFQVLVYETPVTVNSSPPITFDLDADSSMVVGRLPPGQYVVRLAAAGDNCVVANGNPDTVTVSPNTTTPVLFAIACTTPVRPERIAFVVDTTIQGLMQHSVELTNVNGLETAVLTGGHSPAWSPDGTRLAFSTAECLPDGYYYYYFTCTGGLFAIDPETRKLSALPAVAGATEPSWAPAGDAIAYTKCCDAQGQSQGLYVLDLKLSQSAQRVEAVFVPSHPTWSADGKRIAFDCLADQFHSLTRDICVINRDGSGFAILITDTTSSTQPAWSPDGTRIAFTHGQGVAALDLAGGRITPLALGSQPAWSPDGSQLVVVGFDGLYVIDADGLNRRRLTTAGAYAPAWRP